MTFLPDLIEGILLIAGVLSLATTAALLLTCAWVTYRERRYPGRDPLADLDRFVWRD